MLLRLLGPIEVDGTSIAAAKHRSLLAALAIRRGQVADADELIDALWGESPPASAPKLLHVYVSQLRRQLPAGIRVKRTALATCWRSRRRTWTSRRSSGWSPRGALRMPPATLCSARRCCAAPWALWRGPAFADVRYEPFVADEVRRLEALRDRALLERIDAELRLGRHAEILPELGVLITGDPTDEALAAYGVLATYRSLGAAEALALHERVRLAVGDELGEDPGAELMTLRQRIERRDPTLLAEPMPIQRSTLPSPPNPLIGRERELRELADLLERPGVRLVSLTGAGEAARAGSRSSWPGRSSRGSRTAPRSSSSHRSTTPQPCWRRSRVRSRWIRPPMRGPPLPKPSAGGSSSSCSTTSSTCGRRPPSSSGWSLRPPDSSS